MLDDIEILTAEDVTQTNLVYDVHRNDIVGDRIIGGIAWIIRSSEREKSQERILSRLYRTIFRSASDYRFWVLVGHSAFQPNNRITRYWGLWKGLKASGIDISHFGTSYEAMVEYDGELKFFGAKEISELSKTSVVRLMPEGLAVYLALFPENADVEEIVRKGWLEARGFDGELLEGVIDQDGFLIKAVGEFDDVESGFVAVGETTLISELAELFDIGDEAQ